MDHALAVAVIVGFGLGYCVHVWWYPYGDCWSCGGKGKVRSRKGRGRSYRKCRRCKGKGAHVRWMPRVTARARAKAKGRW